MGKPTANQIVNALKPGETAMYVFAQPVSDDARHGIAMLLGKEQFGVLAERYIKMPCGSCRMELAVSEEIVAQVDAGIGLRCPLCAAWLMVQAKMRDGGWAVAMDNDGKELGAS